MKLLLRSIDDIPQSAKCGAMTIGNFDGVHRGHRVLIDRLLQLARTFGGPSIVFTFDPPPAAILAPQYLPPALTWMERRAEILHGLGIDVVVACPTNRELLQLEPEDFFRRILLDRFDCQAFAEGPNFHFGRNRRGDTRMLNQLCLDHGRTLAVVSAEDSDGEMISSSRIRKLILDGRLEQANRLLMEPYRLVGNVIQGEGRGRTLGFPTANLMVERVLIPAHGVYSGRAFVEKIEFRAAIHIGPNPTFGEHQSKVEIHLLDCHRDLYGRELEVELLGQIRGIQKFPSVDQLLIQLQQDIEQVRSTVPLANS